MRPILILEIVGLILCSAYLLPFNDAHAAPGKELLKGRVSVSVDPKVSFPDRLHDVQVLSGLATKKYAEGDLAEAERLYLEALALANKGNAPADSLAILTCNLAAVYRQEKKIPEAAKAFGQAVEICRSKKVRPEVCEYVAKQYAPLLRRSGKQAEADSLLLTARGGFVIAPIALKPESTIVLANNSIRVNDSNQVTTNGKQSPAASPSDGLSSSKSPADEEREAAELVKNDATEQLINMASREPNSADWKILSGPTVSRASSTSFTATIEVNFFTTVPTKQGRIFTNMIGIWHYTIMKDATAHSLSITKKEMPFDVNRSTLKNLGH